MPAIAFDPNGFHAGQMTLTNGNLTAEITVAPWRAIRCTQQWTSGKYYWEVTLDVEAGSPSTQSAGVGFGQATESYDTFIGQSAEGWGFNNEDGNIIAEGVSGGNIGGWVLNDVVGIALDLDTGKAYFSINDVWLTSANPATAANPHFTGITGTVSPWCSLMVSGSKVTINFGETAFAGTVPDGFTAPPGSDVTELLDIDSSGSDVYGSARVFQSFTPDAAWDISQIRLDGAYSTGDGNCVMRLYDESGGEPNTLLGTSLTNNALPASYVPPGIPGIWMFEPAIQVPADGLIYAVMNDNTNGYYIRTGSSVYAGGTIGYYTGAAWVTDAAFEARQFQVEGILTVIAPDVISGRRGFTTRSAFMHRR